MSKITTPYRYDYVGSFLRPEELKQARKGFADGALSREELTTVEDRAIRDLVTKQKAAGYHVLTDGEFRRSTWHLDFMWGFQGVGHCPTKTGLPFVGEPAMLDDTYLTGEVRLEGEHPFVEHFRFVNALTDDNTVAKQTMPSPAQFLMQMILPSALENTGKYYRDHRKLAGDIAAGYREVLGQLYEAGCRNVQLDDCAWGAAVNPKATKVFGVDETGLAAVKELLLEVNNLAIQGRPDDLTVNTHICRGNYHSTYASKGPYDAVAPYLFARENVDGFFLEFDDERSGGFESLSQVAGNKKVVLGLITTKRPELEDRQAVIERIHQAAKYLPLGRLCLSPQCGFASCEIGNKLTEEEQWAKLALVRDIAREVWGETD